MIDVEDKTCPCCRGSLHLIGENKTEMLDYVSEHVRVLVIRRPRYGCRTCGVAVVQASAPERPIDGGMATEALLTHLVVSKYCYHTPLYRVGIPVHQFGRHARVQPSHEDRATTD